MKVTFDNSGSGTTVFVSWERLRPFLESAIELRGDETIEQVDVDKDGLKVRIAEVKP